MKTNDKIQERAMKKYGTEKMLKGIELEVGLSRYKKVGFLALLIVLIIVSGIIIFHEDKNVSFAGITNNQQP